MMNTTTKLTQTDQEAFDAWFKSEEYLGKCKSEHESEKYFFGQETDALAYEFLDSVVSAFGDVHQFSLTPGRKKKLATMLYRFFNYTHPTSEMSELEKGWLVLKAKREASRHESVIKWLGYDPIPQQLCKCPECDPESKKKCKCKEYTLSAIYNLVSDWHKKRIKRLPEDTMQTASLTGIRHNLTNHNYNPAEDIEAKGDTSEDDDEAAEFQEKILDFLGTIGNEEIPISDLINDRMTGLSDTKIAQKYHVSAVRVHQWFKAIEEKYRVAVAVTKRPSRYIRS